mmetsp:Transcript_14629/g.25943  ORF Transcript_14629/g.25943 Transcript_14629/m.25943 type:complete len:112 (-) Transcript_14629:278-613(-)
MIFKTLAYCFGNVELYSLVVMEAVSLLDPTARQEVYYQKIYRSFMGGSLQKYVLMQVLQPAPAAAHRLLRWRHHIEEKNARARRKTFYDEPIPPLSSGACCLVMLQTAEPL